MKKPFYLILCILLLANCSEQTNISKETKTNYDSALAKKTGADSFGMKKYIFCYLKKGPNRSYSKVEASAIQEAHLKNIGKLAKDGSLILAGPFMDTGTVRGIFVFNVPSLEAAQKLVDTDPAVKAGRLIMELHEWYGSAALTQIPDLHNRIQAKSVTD